MMMGNRFKQLDLNLLKVLRVLIEVKNTRKASELLFTSQPLNYLKLNKPYCPCYCSWNKPLNPILNLM